MLLLGKQGLTGVGTVRRDKRFLPERFKHGIFFKKFGSDFAFTSKLSLVSHKLNQKKNVIVISSMHITKDVDEGPIRKCINGEVL